MPLMILQKLVPAISFKLSHLGNAGQSEPAGCEPLKLNCRGSYRTLHRAARVFGVAAHPMPERQSDLCVIGTAGREALPLGLGPKARVWKGPGCRLSLPRLAKYPADFVRGSSVIHRNVISGGWTLLVAPISGGIGSFITIYTQCRSSSTPAKWRTPCAMSRSLRLA
jgi:hypothetical protein